MYLVGSFVLVSLAGCGRGFFQSAEREPWRAEAEVACLKSGAVKETADLVRINPISGPGVCGAEFPLKVAASENPFSHFISAEPVTSAASRACAAPFTTNEAPGSVWNVAAILRSGLKSCAHAARPRKVKMPFCIAKDLSVRMPSSLRASVTLFEA